MNHLKNEKGSISLFLIGYLFLALVLMGAVVDFSLAHTGRKQVQTIAEAAALAGALSAELVPLISVEDGEISYAYAAKINPEAAQQAANAVISQYVTRGLQRSVTITDIEFLCLDEDGEPTEEEGVHYEVRIQASQSSLFGAERVFTVARESQAKLEFIEPEG